MLMPVSSEFVALCRAQIMLLTQALGASISVVYLTQQLEENRQPHLIAIAAYPETLAKPEPQSNILLLPDALQSSQSSPNLLQDLDIDLSAPEWMPNEVSPAQAPSTSAAGPHLPPPLSSPRESALLEQRQIVLPLIYDGGVLGLLVTRRDDRAWEHWEHQQIEEIANTLALACLMDQRYLWGQQEREQERLLHLRQHDLMDNLLHQFRNSLTALQTFGKLIMRRLIPGDRSHELASSWTRETERLRELAQQMELALDMDLISRSRSLPAASSTDAEEQLGDATLEPSAAQLPVIGLLPSTQLPLERCLLETVLEPLLASACAIAPDQQLTIHTQLPEDLPPIWANPAALREALNNLIENAMKYTPPGGQIWVVVNSPEDHPLLEIAISDTGVGIPQEDLSHIFERHFRGVQSHSNIPGSGLGLAITRSLIEQMHGKIQVFSPALSLKRPTPGLPAPPPGGTTFLVELPIAVATET